MLLWNPEGSSGDASADDGEDEDDTTELSKLRSCLLDLLRSIGVSPRTPLAHKNPPPMERLQGWWIVRVYGAGSDQLGSRKEGLLTPVCVDSGPEGVRVGVLMQDERLAWKTYSEAINLLTLRGAKNLTDLNWMDQAAATERFFAECLAKAGECTVFCEAGNIRQGVRGLGNGFLQLGRLELGASGRTSPSRIVQDGGATNIVRIALEAGRSAGYSVEGRVLGFSKGIFSEQDATRTFWIMRGLPRPLDMDLKLRLANKTTRHPDPEDGLGPLRLVKADRRLPSLSEVCIVTSRSGVDPVELADLTRFSMRSHVTSTDELLLPFPLHEARLLGDHGR